VERVVLNALAEKYPCAFGDFWGIAFGDADPGLMNL